ncbi:MAG TPA: DUF4129 domain-containing protein, partial [Chloroflexota bacterium]|nr:DUF4129 domain-containing protein [Chloroflexota bacterium]
TFLPKEWLVILLPIAVPARFLPYLGSRAGSLNSDLSGWLANPFNIFDPGYIIFLLVLLGAWATAFVSAQDLNGLRVQIGELTGIEGARKHQAAWESERVRTIDHTEPLRKLAGRFVTGGWFLILLAGFTAVDVQQFTSWDAVTGLVASGRPTVSATYLNVVIYWVLVLLLLGEAQYVRRRTLWRLDDVPQSETVGTRWVQALVAVVVFAVIVASIMPTDIWLGFSDVLDVLYWGFSTVLTYLMAVVFLLFWLITLPLRLLMSDSTGERPSVSPPPLPDAVAPTGDNTLLEILRLIIFVAFAGSVLIFAVRTAWRERTRFRFWPIIASFISLVARMLRALLGLGGFLRRAAVQIILAIPLVRSRPATTSGRWSGLRSLVAGRDPRSTVEMFYFLAAERAARLGSRREPHITALEYARQIRRDLPEADPEIEVLTDVFVSARFSLKPVGKAEVSLARRAWEDFRRRLRGRMRPSTTVDET